MSSSSAAGGAGLMAACQAHDRGAKVVVFNKGGSSYHTGTNLCGGLFTACGSRMQKADPKIKDDWKAFADDIIAYGEHMSLKEPVYGFTKHSGEAFDWLEDHGLAAHHLEPYAGHTNVRAHRQDSFKGRDYIDVLEKEIKARKIEDASPHAGRQNATSMKPPTVWSAFSAAVRATSSTAEPKWAS